MQRRPLIITTLLLPLSAGCATQLPTYAWVDHATAMRSLAERSDRVETLSSSCRVLLTSRDGRSTELSGAIAARPPHEFRLRAWKLSQPVLDLTLTPAGLWVFRAEQAGEDPLRALSADRMRFGWTTAMGGFDDSGWIPLDDTGGATFQLRRTEDDKVTVVATIERCTLTARKIELFDPDGRARLKVSLDAYRVIDDIPWPTRMTFRSEQGTIAVLMEDPELNRVLPARAFIPPRRAVRQP